MSLITSPIGQRFYFEAPRNSAFVNVKKCNFKEEYNPFSNNLYLNQRGVAKLVDIGHRAGSGTKYMGHYTEADLPPDYTIRDIAYALTSDTRIVTVGAKAPYLIENLVKMDGYWEAPKFRVGYHKDDIHPVTIKSESLNPYTAKIEFTSSIKLFLDWAYANNISLNMNPSHKLQVNYGKYIPPNNLLRKVGYIQVAGGHGVNTHYYDSREQIALRETLGERVARLKLKYIPKNANQCKDSTLEQYNRLQIGVVKGEITIIDSTDTLIREARTDFGGYGFLFYCLCGGEKVNKVTPVKFLNMLITRYPKIFQYCCGKVYVDKRFLSLQGFLTNISQIPYPTLVAWLLAYARSTLQIPRAILQKATLLDI